MFSITLLHSMPAFKTVKEALFYLPQACLRQLLVKIRFARCFGDSGHSEIHDQSATDYQKVWCKKTIIHPPFLIPISTIRCKRLMPHLSDRALLESPLAFQEFNVTSYSETPAASDTAFVN